MYTYVIGDVHGYKELVEKLLKELEFESCKDMFYFIGNYCNFGDKNAETLFYMMDLEKKHKNVKCLVGNHDLMLMKQLRSYNHTPKKEDIYYDKNFLYYNGGKVTFNEVLSYPMSRQNELENWIDNLPYRIDLKINGTKYALVSASIEPIVDRDDSRFESYRENAVWNETVLNMYSSFGSNEIANKILKEHNIDKIVFGNTLVTELEKQYSDYSIASIFNDNYIAVNCGTELMKSDNKARLACIRLEDMQETYIK